MNDSDRQHVAFRVELHVFNRGSELNNKGLFV